MHLNFLLFTVLLLCCMHAIQAIWQPPIIMKGEKFFSSDDSLEFRVKGIAYYPRPNAGDLNENSIDFFTEEYKNLWTRDIANLKELGVNTVRIYAVDPTQNHDAFFCELSKNGMYAIIGMAAQWENQSIPKVEPPACYFSELYERAMMIYNAFAVYDNVLAFSVGNENNHGKGGPETMPCVKSMIRDVNAYAKGCTKVLREVPIGLFIADGEQPREDWISFLDCVRDDDKHTRAQWIGLNTYIECDVQKQLTYDQSAGFKNLVKDLKDSNYSRPFMLGEYGCIEIESDDSQNEQQRPWRQTTWMHENYELTSQLVGGCAFEYSIETTNTPKLKEPYYEYDGGKYGIGYFTPENCDEKDIPCEYVKHSQFDTLAKRHNELKPSTLKKGDFDGRTYVSKCPSLFFDVPLPPKPEISDLVCSSYKPMCDGATTKGASVNGLNDDSGDYVDYPPPSIEPTDTPSSSDQGTADPSNGTPADKNTQQPTGGQTPNETPSVTDNNTVNMAFRTTQMGASFVFTLVLAVFLGLSA